ncbi:MAG: DNA primase [Candidatus Babeliaceae bacterium]|nr:DNA primase [Candidatus Babeliaceae bacterium]
MNIFSIIKTHIHILDVIQEYTTLKRAGNYWKGQCPFHHERTASFTVSPHKEIFYCFGCHSGGDVVAFITKVERCSPLEAVKHLADRYAIQLPQETVKQFTASKHEKELYTHVHEMVATWCIEQFKKSQAVQEYLKKRGITQSSIANFSIGYFPGGQQSIKRLLAFCKQANILAQDLIHAHILREGQAGFYSPYEERITFPIHDSLGRACGLGGRIFMPEDSRAKYYNSQDHPYFSKGSILYGFHQAKKYIQETGTVYLVEGYLDCIAFAQAGMPQTVATLGTACTVEHIKNLSRYAQKLYTVYDGDSAGQKAALRLTQLCWDVDLEPYVIQLPLGDDPCSYVAKGAAVKNLVDNAVTIFEYFIQKTVENSSGIELSLQERMSRIKSIIELIAQIQDPIKQDLLLQKAAQACQVPYDNLKKNLIERARRHVAISPEITHKNVQKNEANTSFEKVNTQIEISDLEKKIFSGIISRKYLLKPEEHAFLKLAFSSYLFPIIERFQAYKDQLNEVSITDLCADHEKEFIVSLLMEDEVQGQGPALEELFSQFYKKRWKMIVNGVKIKIAQAQKLNKNQELETIIAQFQNLKQKLFMKDQV